MPLPAGLDEGRLLAELDPRKDVDGVHPENLGRLYLGAPRFVPCTAAAVARILEAERIETAGRHAVVVGRSVVVGRAVALLLLEKGARGDATVTVCHSRTPDLAAHTRRAEILVAAIGRAGAIRGDMLRPGVVAIDVGTSSVPDPSAKRGFRIAGDLDFASVAAVASRVTPVPGGVGPVTVAMLLANTALAARRRLPTPSTHAGSPSATGGPA
jgi:methylenetetrahydrofolate dehydrogenase (NADP+)/methenyltetrahydrofolate cyclohydrolase